MYIIVSQIVCDTENVDRIAPLQAWNVTRHTAPGQYTRGIYYIPQRLIVLSDHARRRILLSALCVFCARVCSPSKEISDESLKKERKKKVIFTEKEPNTPAISFFCTQIFIAEDWSVKGRVLLCSRDEYSRHVFGARGRIYCGALWISFWRT